MFVSACVCVKQFSSTCGGRIRICECVRVRASNSLVQHVVVGYVFVSACACVKQFSSTCGGRIRICERVCVRQTVYFNMLWSDTYL